MLLFQLFLLNLNKSLRTDASFNLHVNVEIYQMFLQRNSTLNIIFHVFFNSFRDLFSLNRLFIKFTDHGRHGTAWPDNWPVNHIEKTFFLLKLQIETENRKVTVARLFFAFPFIQYLETTQNTFYREESMDDYFNIWVIFVPNQSLCCFFFTVTVNSEYISGIIWEHFSLTNVEH